MGVARDGKSLVIFRSSGKEILCLDLETGDDKAAVEVNGSSNFRALSKFGEHAVWVGGRSKKYDEIQFNGELKW